jgi:hypothetical protein
VSRQFRIRRKSQGKKSERLHRAQEAAQAGTARAAERIGPAAKHAREVAADRVTDARGWSAPRLKRAARYVESELGPKVGSAMRTTADKVEPARPRNWRRVFAAVLLTVGGLAGALGAAARRRKAAPAATTGDEDVPAAADAQMSNDGQVRTP